MTAVDIVAIIFVDIFMYLFGCAACLFVARLPWPTKYINEPQWVARWRFSKKDSVAIMVSHRDNPSHTLTLLYSIVVLQRQYLWVFH